MIEIAIFTGYELILESDEEGKRLAELIRKHKNRKLTKKDKELIKLAKIFKGVR